MTDVKDWAYEQRRLAVEFATTHHLPLDRVYGLLNTFGRSTDRARLTRAVVALLDCECLRFQDFENYDWQHAEASLYDVLAMIRHRRTPMFNMAITDREFRAAGDLLNSLTH